MSTPSVFTVEYLRANSMGGFGCSDDRINDKGWLFVSIGSVCRDSEARAQSNHRVVLRELSKISKSGAGFGILRCSHWAVGWVDHIIVSPNAKKLLKAIEEMTEAIESYPILDDSDCSELELELHEDNRCDDGCSECEYQREMARTSDARVQD